MRKSLTLRLTLFFGVVSTAVLVAIGYLIAAAVEQHFIELDRSDLESKRDQVRTVLAKVGSPDQGGEARSRLDDVLVGEMPVFARITDADGAPIYSTANARFPESWSKIAPGPHASSADELATWRDNGHRYRGLRTRIPLNGLRDPARLELAISIDHHDEFLQAFYRKLWAAVAVAIVTSALLGWLAAQRGLAPLRTMARVAHNITASRLDDRLSVDTLPVELVDLADAFNAMLGRLEDSFRRLSEFSSDLAHELRTPISNLLTHTQVALQRSRSTEEYREVLYSNIEEFERLARTISDMLFLAKADNGLIVPRTEVVDLANEVRDLFDYYDALVDERGVRLGLTGEGTVPGERLMIRRAISNLLSNAVNHTPRGGTISVRIDREDTGGVRVAVENNGETIPSEHLPRLFDRFYRVDPARQRLGEGAGLGLAITKSIVAAHRGFVRAFSADGITRVEMIFPGQRPG